MAIWYPTSGLTWSQFMQANSFFRDVTGQVHTSERALSATLSQEAKKLVAGNEQLAASFGAGFNQLDGTLRWGFGTVQSAIDNLASDFNYQAGLLLEQLRIEQRLLDTIIGKLDAIHRTLENPTWTKMREFYRKGCNLVSKSILDKAVEAFKQAESIDDTDFFVQFELGKLYLYGADDDENVIELRSAKKHLLTAARYARGEISVDPSFAKYAAEALFHASVANYALSGEKDLSIGRGQASSLIREAVDLIENALKLRPDFLEARYHKAKYAGLLGDSNGAIQSLEGVIRQDWRYAVKADVDRGFDRSRREVVALLAKLRSEALKEAKGGLESARKAIERAQAWCPQESAAQAKKANDCFVHFPIWESYVNSDSANYLGLLEGIRNNALFVRVSEEITASRRDELQKELEATLRDGASTLQVIDHRFCGRKEENDIAAAEAIFEDSKSHSRDSYPPLRRAIDLAQQAQTHAARAKKSAEEAYYRNQKVEKAIKAATAALIIRDIGIGIAAWFVIGSLGSAGYVMFDTKGWNQRGMDPFPCFSWTGLGVGVALSFIWRIITFIRKIR